MNIKLKKTLEHPFTGMTVGSSFIAFPVAFFIASLSLASLAAAITPAFLTLLFIPVGMFFLFNSIQIHKENKSSNIVDDYIQSVIDELEVAAARKRNGFSPIKPLELDQADLDEADEIELEPANNNSEELKP